jgi:hypothetical protein
VPYTPGREDNNELIDATGLPWSNATYPLGLTPRQGVRQILPNHHLELTSFAMHRDWPVAPWATDPDVDTSVATISDLTIRNVQATVQATPCYLPLTAGRDSRMLLACARDIVSELRLYTVPMPDRRADLDTRVAAKIGGSLGLNHEIVPYLPPLQADLDEWMFRISYGTGEPRGWRVSTTYNSLDPERTDWSPLWVRSPATSTGGRQILLTPSSPRSDSSDTATSQPRTKPTMRFPAGWQTSQQTTRCRC